ncbi:MAG: hypothetical protein JXR94_08235 [Candidatus Hydrogenedentes bacterium]|nr:hypothetical protein [Candidatus Hydrogenedentota bacterium]
MMISILATKCRYCGEEVGRPKDETRTMTVADLGGETVTRYATSATVMEALEAFRSEEEMKSNPPDDAEDEKRSLFRRKSKSRAAAEEEISSDPVLDGLPELDERSQALASLTSPSAPKRRGVSRRRPEKPTWMKRVAVFAGLVAGIVILYLGAVKGFAMMRAGDDAQEPQTRKYANEAESILANDGDPIKALTVAVEAQRKEDHPKNRQVLQAARDNVIAAVQAHLNATPWSLKDLSTASGLATQALDINPHDDTRALKEEVDREYFDYYMVLDAISKEEGESIATFRLNQGVVSDEAGATVKAKVGDVVQERFEVAKIASNYVRVLDKKRNSRMVTYDLSGNIR